jgi:hypothetical protein
MPDGSMCMYSMMYHCMQDHNASTQDRSIGLTDGYLMMRSERERKVATSQETHDRPDPPRCRECVCEERRRSGRKVEISIRRAREASKSGLHRFRFHTVGQQLRDSMHMMMQRSLHPATFAYLCSMCKKYQRKRGRGEEKR